MTQGQVILKTRGKGDPIVIKTEVVERTNLDAFLRENISGRKSNTVQITMPRLDFIRKEKD